VVLAFVLINTEIGYEKNIHMKICEFDGVKDAYQCHGVYNIIAEIISETTEELRKLVYRFQKIDKVRSTLTMLNLA